MHVTPTTARSTPSAWNHEHDGLSDFIPIDSLLEWQWRRIVMRNSQFYHPSRTELVGPPNAKKSPRAWPFYQVMQAQVGEPTTHPPTPPSVSTRNLSLQVQQILERPSEGQAPPKCRHEAIVLGRVQVMYHSVIILGYQKFHIMATVM